MSALKCYVGGSKYQPNYEFVEVCFAANQKEAKNLMWNHSFTLPEECDGEWLDAKIVRKSEFDHFLKKGMKDGYIVRDNSILRQMGWRYEGDESCCHCGFYEMDGDFPVCLECNSCSECGHDDNCESANTSLEETL